MLHACRRSDRRCYRGGGTCVAPHPAGPGSLRDTAQRNGSSRGRGSRGKGAMALPRRMQRLGRTKNVCPGDMLMSLPETGVVRIGGGVRQDGEALVATKAGVLQQAKGGKLWVEARQRRYIASPEDVVIGRIIDKHSENYGVDIGGPFRALLPVLAFEGATKRNRPQLVVGDLVYGRVESAHRDLEPMLSCMDAAGKASGFAHLQGGMMIEVSTTHARSLLSRPPAVVLSALGRSLQFELAVGQNGRVWLDAPSPATVILVANAIQSSEFLSPTQQEALVAALLKGSSTATAQRQQHRQQQQRGQRQQQEGQQQREQQQQPQT